MTPYIPKDLLEHLQKAFPNTLPKAQPSPEVLGQLIGHQRVIDYLKHNYDRQAALSSDKPKD